MSAELNVQVKLNVSKAEIQAIAAKLNKSLGGVLGSSPTARPTTPITTLNRAATDRANTEAAKKHGLTLKDAAAGMLRSLILYRAISESLSMMKRAVDSVTDSFEKSKKLYVGGAMSGLGTRLQTQRTSIAGILGVSESDLMRFGDAYKYYSKELQGSLDIISKNARPLAETNMQWGALKVRIEAFGSSYAAAFKPAIDGFIQGLGDLIEFLTKNAGKISTIVDRIMKASPLYWVAKAAQMAGAASAGANPFSGLDAYKNAGKGQPGLPPQMKQLSASSWEKMGLVIGGGGAANYPKQTADNTKRTVSLLQTIATRLSSQQEGKSVFQSIPAIP